MIGSVVLHKKTADFLKYRVDQISGLLAFAEYLAGKNSMLVRVYRNSMIAVYENSLLHLRSPTGTLETLKKNLAAEGLRSSDPGNAFAAVVASEDIITFLESGKGLLPAEPGKIPEAIERFKLERQRQYVEKYEAERKKLNAAEAKNKSALELEEKKARLEELGVADLVWPLIKEKQQPGGPPG